MTAEGPMIVHRSRFVEIPSGNITALAFSHKSDAQKLTPSDLRLALGTSDGNIEIWNPRDDWFQELIIQSGKDRSIEGLCWRNVPGESLRLFSIGGSTVVTEWDLSSGLPLKNYDCNAGVIWSLAIDESQDRLAVGCDNGAVVLIDISGGPGSLEYEGSLMRQESRILALAWKGSDCIIGGCSDGRIRVWSAKKDSDERGRILHTMKVDKSKKESTLVWSVLYLATSNQIVSGDSTGSVKFWDFSHATLTQSFKPHIADVLSLTQDAEGTKVFSAGVDRKIFQFQRNNGESQKERGRKWVNSSNRLIHGNDVRAMCAYQSRGADFLVSGGVEKSLVINSLSSFADGKYRKMPLFSSIPKSVIINRTQRFVVMWHESNIRIWFIGHDFESANNYKLVCKLILKDEEKITTCAMSPDGQVLVVARPSSTKLFHLQPVGTKLKVTKLDNDLLLHTGCSLVQFADNSRIVACSTDNELFTVDLESDQDNEMQVIDLPEVPQTKSSIKIPYMNKINRLAVGGTYAVVGYTCGSVDIVNLKNLKTRTVVRLMNFITSLCINNGRSSVVLTTADNKIYEFGIGDEETESSLLTDWSRNNTENIPAPIQSSNSKCTGIFSCQEDATKVWFWSPSWLSRLDFSVDLPVSRRKKAKKHGRDGLTITDDSNFLNDAGEAEDDNDLEVEEAIDFLSASGKYKINGGSKVKSEGGSLFFTEEYKPLFYADLISDKELFVIERPASSSSSRQGAVDLPKLVF